MNNKLQLLNSKISKDFIGLLELSILILCFNQFFLLKLIDEVTSLPNSANLLSHLMSILAISKIIILPLSGFFTDKYGEKKVIFAGGIFLLPFSFYLFIQGFSTNEFVLISIIGGRYCWGYIPATILFGPTDG